MPVYDYNHMPVKDLPDQVCLVLKPIQNPTDDPQNHQSGPLTIRVFDSYGIVGYLPVYKDYQQAMEAHPGSHIHMMDLTEYKKEIGLMP